MQGAVDDDRLQFWQFLVTIALLSVAGLSVVTVVLRVRIDRVATDMDGRFVKSQQRMPAAGAGIRVG